MSEFIVEVLCHVPFDGLWEEWHYFSATKDEDGMITGVFPIFHPHQKSYDDHYDLTPERLTHLMSGSRRLRHGAFNYATVFPLGDEDAMRQLQGTVPFLVMPALLKAFEASGYDEFRRPWFRCERCGTAIHESDDCHLGEYAGDGHGVAFLPNIVLCTNCYESGAQEGDPDDHEE